MEACAAGRKVGYVDVVGTGASGPPLRFSSVRTKWVWVPGFQVQLPWPAGCVLRGWACPFWRSRELGDAERVGDTAAHPTLAGRIMHNRREDLTTHAHARVQCGFLRVS